MEARENFQMPISDFRFFKNAKFQMPTVEFTDSLILENSAKNGRVVFETCRAMT
jgi:hypothetical protein